MSSICLDKEVSDIDFLLTLHDLQIKEKLSHSNIEIAYFGVGLLVFHEDVKIYIYVYIYIYIYIYLCIYIP